MKRATDALPGKLVAREPLITWHSPSLDEQTPAVGRTSYFQLINKGGGIVRITSVESGCGCAQPTVSPMAIEPGTTATVAVEARPLPFGERTVAFWIGTDSPITPKILLKMRIIGYCEPPLLAQVGGDLTFRSSDATDEARDLVVRTIEPEQRDRIPIIKNTISFLTIDDPALMEEPYLDGKSVLRTYTYKVRVTGSARQGTFVGEVAVEDPWQANNVERVPVYIKKRHANPRFP